MSSTSTITGIAANAVTANRITLLSTDGEIDTKATAGSVINSIGSNTSYYVFDHLDDHDYAENCNSAVDSTIKFKKPNINNMQVSK